MSADTDYDQDDYGDDYHERFMGPPLEEPDDEPPLTLEEIQAAYDEAGGKIWELGPAARIVAAGVVQLMKELRWARESIRQRGVEYTVTDGTPPEADAELVTGEQASLIMRNNPARLVWERDAYAGPWQQLSSEPPF